MSSHPAPRREAWLESLEARVNLNAGDLDATFSGDGQATIASPGGGQLFATDVAVQSTGKTVVVGVGVGGTFNNRIVVARFDVAGVLDPTFGSSGLMSIGYANTNVTAVVTTGMVIQQADDKIVLVGSYHFNDADKLLLMRLTANGVLDTSFGGDGRVERGPTFAGQGVGVTGDEVILRPDGRIVVSASVELSPSNHEFGIGRFLEDGTPDTTFSGDGEQVVGFGGDDFANSLAIDPAGRVVVVGTRLTTGASTDSDRQFAVLRLTPSGGLDSSFSGDGKVLSRFTADTLYSSARAVVIQPTGKIVIAGEIGGEDAYGHDTGLFRLNDNGTGDPTFGVGNGQIQIDFGGGDVAQSMIAGQSGRLLVGGTRSIGNASLACLTADGQLDPIFDGDGKRVVQIPQARGLALAPTGKFVIAGGNGFATARLSDRAFATISLGTFQPQMYEQGALGTSFFVTRSERLPTPTRVFISTGGQAIPPAVLPFNSRDYNGENILFGNGLTSSTYVDIPAEATFTVVNITPIDDTRVEGDETAIFSIAHNAAYDFSPTRTTTLVIRDNDVFTAPVVAASQFVFETAPHRLTFRFDQQVGASLAADDFQITGPLGIPSFTFNYDTVTNTATLSFDSLLPDGNYTARVLAPGVTTANGMAMAADHVLPFFVLAGDANRDRSVNFADLVVLAQNYNLTDKTFSQGNFDYSTDGAVDFADLVILAQKYNVSLATPQTIETPSSPTRATTRRPTMDVLE